MRILSNLFKGKAQGKDYTKEWKAKRRDHAIARTGALGGSGALTGAVIGAAAGGLKAHSEIRKVPFQEVTVEHYEPVLQSEKLGMIPPDDYESGSWRPSDDGVPTEGVYRNNPVYLNNGEPRVRATSTTFRGRGEPQPTTWRTDNIKHHTMDGYRYSTTEDNERYISHYQTVQRSRQVYDGQESYTDTDCATSYNSDGSTSYDCDTVTRYRDTYRTEYYTEEEPVYAWRTIGHWQNYTPNIHSRVVGSVETPNVTFDHGVDVSNYVMKGMLWGAAIGAVAGGVAAALEEEYFPNVLPGYTPKPTPGNGEPSKPDPVKPSPGKPSPGKPVPGKPVPGKPGPGRPDPVRPAPPKSDCGKGRKRHTHDNGQFRHTHAHADRWHYHGCPDTGVFNENIICFKPNQVPDCYKDEKVVSECGMNGSVCYTNKG